MSFAPPLIKPPLPPLKPPPAPPFKIPPILREPPTQTDPQIEIPNKPPTQTDLLGVVCIYSNRPIFTPKKIRYKYPGQEWQEIAGDRFELNQSPPEWIPLPIVSYRVDFQGTAFNGQILTSFFSVQGGFSVTRKVGTETAGSQGVGLLFGDTFEVKDLNGTRNLGNVSAGPWTVTEFSELPRGAVPWQIQRGSFQIIRVIRTSDNQEIPPLSQCTFNVFDINNQLILSLSNDVCPDVQVLPEKCEYKQENERLVKKWIVGFFQNLRIEYQDNCATVWLDSPPFFPTQVYRECSDAACPPPKIRFDKKCEKPCKKCPSGTITRVLNGNNLLCVDGRGCLIKTIKFDSRCEGYDCIC